MVNKSSGKLLHIEPQQFEVLLSALMAKTPPKTQTAFSVKQLVGRLYEFMAQSLARHYSFEELAGMIQTSLAELETVEDVPEIKGATLRQYFLEVKRERDGQMGTAGRSAGRKKPGARSVKADLGGREKVPIGDSDAGVPETGVEIPRRAPATKSATVDLAY